MHESKELLARHIASILVNNIKSESHPTWCLASGRTPELSYREFSDIVLENEYNVSQLTLFALDEWMGLQSDSDRTCSYFFDDVIVKPLNISPEKFIHFNTAGNEDTEIKRMNNALSQIPCFDLSVLGLGLNGHVGFNEPDHEIHPSVHSCDLSDSSLTHSMLNNISILPRRALTIGFREILASKKILLLITGGSKIEITKRFISSHLNCNLPASLLKLHNNIEIHVDPIIYKCFQ